MLNLSVHCLMRPVPLNPEQPICGLMPRGLAPLQNQILMENTAPPYHARSLVPLTQRVTDLYVWIVLKECMGGSP